MWGGSRGIAPRIPCLDGHYMKVSGFLHFPTALSPGKEPLVAIALKAGWAPEPVLVASERKDTLLPQPGIQPQLHDFLVTQLVAFSLY